uniref:SWIM-type domain-containing protein n=1 Tax=viral metagenome TaxID=1070528 RepID=A0A6M3LTV6_9ZZZZ
MRRIFFDIPSSTSKEIHGVVLYLDEEGNILKYSCTCIFSSFYCWTKKNLIENKICRHIKEAIKQYENGKKY